MSSYRLRRGSLMGGSAILAIFASGMSLVTADLLDVPGPGYRRQSETFHGRPAYRLDLLDASPPKRLSPEARAVANERLLQRVRGFDRVRHDRHPEWLAWELHRLGLTRPELPIDNPFERPIRLLEVPVPSAANRRTLFNAQ